MKRGLLALSVLTLEACGGCGGGGGGGEVAGADSTTAAWSRVGFDGKTVRALTYDPQTSALYAALAEEGLYRTSNGGTTWSLILENPDVRNVAVDALVPTTLYAATGTGLFRSVDGGASWSRLELGNGGAGPMVVQLQAGPPSPPPSVNVVATDPVLSNIVYAGGDSGFYSSYDGGKTWMIELTKDGTVRDLAVAMIGSYRFLYVATDAGIHNLIINSPTETEHAWALRTQEATTALAADPSNAWTLYAAFEDRFARSFEGGAAETWTTILQGESRDIALPATGIVLVASASGIFRSDDMGGTWVDLSIAGQSPTRLAVASEKLIYVGTQGGGVFKVRGL